MQTFTIDYLTGNTGTSYTGPNMSSDAEVHVTNHDGLLTHIGSNYLHTSLHLEDVYSVISKDAEHSSNNHHHVISPLATESSYRNIGRETSPLATESSYPNIGRETSPLATESSYTNIGCETSPLVIDSSYASSSSDASPLSSPQTNTHQRSGSDGSPASTASNVSAEAEYHYTLERATPSPNKDSGIESDNSPVSNYSTESIEKSLRDLEKKAEKIKAPKTSSTEKPSHSYIALIAMALLDSRDKKLTLGDIYRHIKENHSYYNNEEKAWRNSIRYNLSINECFIKAGKDEIGGKGNLWGIHPACFEDFKNGDFRRRQARRRAKKTLRGLGHADSTPGMEYAARISSAYQTMTPSYVNYHPYATSGLLQRQQQMADYAHAYNGHYAMPSASYYNTLGHYPASQYTSIGMPSYTQPTYEYKQHVPRGISRYETANDSAGNNNVKSGYEESGLKFYPYSTTETQSESVPSNNKIEIL